MNNVKELKKRVRQTHNPTQAGNAYLVHLFLKKEEQKFGYKAIEKFGTRVKFSPNINLSVDIFSTEFKDCRLQLWGENGFKGIPLIPQDYPDPFYSIVEAFEFPPEVELYSHVVIHKGADDVTIAPLEQVQIMNLHRVVKQKGSTIA